MKWRFCKITDITESEYKAVYESLTPSRCEHIDGMNREDARMRSLAATHLLNMILKESGCLNAKLETDQNGKPYLSGCDLFISLSHSEEGVVAAVSHSPIGIDIEKIRPIDDKLIDYVCNANEKAYVLSGNEDKNRRFLTVWTAKEAIFKKVGGKSARAVDTTEFSKTTHCIEDFVIAIV